MSDKFQEFGNICDSSTKLNIIHKVGRIALGLHLSISLETGPNFDLPSFSNLITVFISLIVILESSGPSLPCMSFSKSYKVCLTLWLISLVFWLFNKFWK